jgi:myo-inositol-1(or 4)-monophosphatase
MKPSLTQLRDLAIDAAHAGGRVLVKHFGGKLKISEKKGAGLVTNADLEAEDAVVRKLKRGAPDFGFLTEEAPPVEKPGPGRWIIDPLDGTTNFVHRFPMFCVSIAAEWEGEIVVGVIYHPILRDTYVAVRGKGAFLLSASSSRERQRLRVSKTARLEDSLLTTGFTYRRDDWLKMEMQAFKRLSGLARAVRRPGSAALDLAYTARGVFDGFWERSLSPWDVAAGALLVQEAGGRVSDFKNQPFDLNQKEILASNSRLHPLLCQVIAPEYCLL